MRTLPTVVLVDDRPELLEMLESATEGLGLHVLKARSAEEALELVGNLCPALVITDYFMGDMTGWDLIVALRSKWPYVECVLLTASDFRPPEVNPKVDLLRKPLSAEEFEVLERKLKFAAESGLAVPKDN